MTKSSDHNWSHWQIRWGEKWQGQTIWLGVRRQLLAAPLSWLINLSFSPSTDGKIPLPVGTCRACSLPPWSLGPTISLLCQDKAQIKCPCQCGRQLSDLCNCGVDFRAPQWSFCNSLENSFCFIWQDAVIFLEGTEIVFGGSDYTQFPCEQTVINSMECSHDLRDELLMKLIFELPSIHIIWICAQEWKRSPETWVQLG